MGGGCCVSNHPIRDFFRDIFCSDGGCCVGNSSRSANSESHATTVANELATMREKTQKSSEETEEQVMKYINCSMDSFMQELEKINQKYFYGETLNINTMSINEKNEQLKSQVKGCISTYINTRLVQTDKELSTILAEKTKRKRKDNFEKFVEKLKKQALTKLRIKIEKTVKEQEMVVASEIDMRKSEIDTRLEENIRELTEILEVKKKNEDELSKRQMEYMYQSSICGLILEEIKA